MNFTQQVLSKGGDLFPLIIPNEQTQGLGLCNPSILIDGEEILLNIRNVQYSLYHSENKQQFQSRWGPLSYLHSEKDQTLKTINYLGNLNKDTFKLENPQLIDTSNLDQKPKWEFIGLEDGRLVKWDDKLFLIGVRRDTTSNGQGRMEFSQIENNKEVERFRIEVPNSSSYCEKNWMPILDMPYHFVKWSNPLEIMKVNLDDNSSETVHLSNTIHPLPRDIRGGSQVIKIGKYRIAITHEVDLYNNEVGNKDAQYYHRFLVWDEDWNLIKYSDELKFLDANIEFSCGMAQKGLDVLITFGFQDSTAFILKTPIDFLSEYLGIEFEVDKTNHPGFHQLLTTPLFLDYIKDPQDQHNNFNLANFYFNKKQYSSALSFYLRTAEYGDKENLIYESLIQIAKCLGSLGERPFSEKGAYLNAISFQPNRPEAYFFLSQYFEYYNEWMESYTMACIGLTNKNNASSSVPGYPGEFGLIFQKAVSCWWIGKTDYSRELFFKLSNEFKDELIPPYKDLVQQNITNLGSSRDPFLPYVRDKHSRLREKFKDSELITRNFSQTYQDMFILTMLEGKKNGTYLEIGSADPYIGNNTCLLEQNYGWEGVSIEILEDTVKEFNQKRKNPAYCLDATKIDYKKLLEENNLPKNIDYLQLDCEPPSTTFEILKLIPFDTYKFAVITFEHDYYADVTKSYREKSREYLKSKGYQLLVSDIAPDDKSNYEDWWIHPDLINPKLIKKMSNLSPITKNAENYMLEP